MKREKEKALQVVAGNHNWWVAKLIVRERERKMRKRERERSFSLRNT